MEYPLVSSPHLHAGRSVAWTMRQVMYALLPAVGAYIWLFGWGIVVHLVLAMATAAATEAIALRLRQRPVLATLSDGSALLTGMLLALALPPLAPWWITVIGAAFAILAGKHLFGGLGYNPFNPAMTGYVLLLISFPVEMTRWPLPLDLAVRPPDLLDSLNAVFTGTLGGGDLDAVSGATVLDTLRTQLGRFHMLSEVVSGPPFGHLAGVGWEWIALCYLAGGGYLLARRVISWHIPVAVLATLFLVAGVFQGWDAERFAAPMLHLFAGGAMLGAFFIATDPVSAPTTPGGRLWFGVGIGLLIYVIRTWGGYPDGVAFAVLLMNIAAPSIDYYTRPRVFGHPK